MTIRPEFHLRNTIGRQRMAQPQVIGSEAVAHD
jgi:hypothetical protein